jgi:ankyrin repeat protein
VALYLLLNTSSTATTLALTLLVWADPGCVFVKPFDGRVGMMIRLATKPSLADDWNRHRMTQLGLSLETGEVNPNLNGQPLLSRPAEKDQEAIAKLLLETGKVNHGLKDENGRTSLSWAVEKGHAPIVKLLLETNEVNPDSKDVYGWTPLSTAAEKGYEAIAKLLLETRKVDPDVGDGGGRTPLLWGVEKGHAAVVKLLLEIGKANPDFESAKGQTPLSQAIERGSVAVVQLLLAREVKIDYKYPIYGK